MKFRLVVSAVLISLLSISPALASIDTKRSKSRKAPVFRAAKLVALLPPSDGVITVDAKRFFNESLQTVLSSNQQMLGDVMSQLTETANKTGIDLRKFDEVAVGVKITQIGPGNTDFDPVAIASGDINAGALVPVAELSSKGSYRVEKIAGRTVYVYSAKGTVTPASGSAPASKVAAAIDRAVNGLVKEVAISAYDANSVIIGSLARVRETLEARAHPTPDITTLLRRNGSAVLNFAAKTPNGLDGMLPLGQDVLGKNLRSIRYLSGSVDLAATGATLAVTAKTERADQALNLKNTVEGLRMFGGIFAASKRADQQVYARMIKNVKVANVGSEVTLDLTIPQADIDVLISGAR